MPTSFDTHAGGDALLAADVNTIQTAVNQLENSTAHYAADAEASDTYVISLTPAAASPAAGHTYRFKPNTSNTGAATLNVGSGGNKAIVRPNGDALQTGDLIAGRIYQVTYDGTSFQLTGCFGPYHTQVLNGWYHDTVTAGLTDDAMTLFGAAAGEFMVMPRPGHVIGVFVWSDDARTAGTLTQNFQINGSSGTITAVLDASNTTYKSTEQAAGVDTFSAGDRLGMVVTTDGSWAPVTANILAGVIVEYTDS